MFVRGNGDATPLLLFYFISAAAFVKIFQTKSQTFAHFLKKKSVAPDPVDWHRTRTRERCESKTQEVVEGGVGGVGGGSNHAKSTLILPRPHVRLPNSAALSRQIWSLSVVRRVESVYMFFSFFNKVSHIRGSSSRCVHVTSVSLVSDRLFLICL